MGSLNFIETTDQVVRGAAVLLKKTGVKVGLTGFCLGGAVTILGAARIPEIGAAVCFYGLPPDTIAKAADVKVPLQGHFATRDDWCTPQSVDAFEAGLKAARKNAEFFRYEADHGFMNEQRDVHERAAAELAWERTLAFWKANLGSEQ
jgi:carboxymethylenebutenolidase